MAIRRATSSKVLGDTYRNAQTNTGAADAWVRPADWLTLPTASNSFVGLMAVYDNDSNYVALSAAGNYTVDWGDGSAAENINSGITVEHKFNYADVAGSECSRGYRQAIVTVTPQAGQTFTTIDIDKKHTNFASLNGSTLWLDVEIDGPSLTSILVGAVNWNIKQTMLERARIGAHSLTTTAYMFRYCSSLREVPLFDTSGMTNMSNMFYGCYAITEVPQFNTSSATDLSSMFYDCANLIEVPLFNTSNVLYMYSMFRNCSSLSAVPLLDTGSVTTMDSMFYGCTFLRDIPLLNTTNVTNMYNMFNGCYALRNVPLFDTSNVTNMGGMFVVCTSLSEVPLFNTNKVTNMSSMFNGCYILRKVPLFNTVLVTTMSSMFAYCYNLHEVPAFTTTAVTNMSSMFYFCRSLREVPALDCSAVSSAANLNSTFVNCSSLSRVKATGFKYSLNVQNIVLGAAELNELYSGLATVVGQTITVTGNPGVGGDDPTIATAKGWTVTGS